jgi:hypothetical protein
MIAIMPLFDSCHEQKEPQFVLEILHDFGLV